MTKQEQLLNLRYDQTLARILGRWRKAEEIQVQIYLLSALPIEKEVGQ